MVRILDFSPSATEWFCEDDWKGMVNIFRRWLGGVKVGAREGMSVKLYLVLPVV